jgi:hypothetical protein
MIVLLLILAFGRLPLGENHDEEVRYQRFA